MTTRRSQQLRIADQKSFLTGLLYIAFGLGSALISSTSYTMGTLARLGPGYFPFLLGLLLTALGLIVSLRSLRFDRAPTPAEGSEGTLKFFDDSFPILIWIISSVVLFGLVLKTLGLVVSVLLLVVISSLASHARNARKILLSAALITLISYVAFYKGMGLLLPLWPVFV